MPFFASQDVPAVSEAQQDALAAQIGSCLIVGFAGTQPEDPGVRTLRRLAESGQIGGVIFFSYNIQNPNQLQNLVAEMRGWSTPNPLIIAVDQEGGRVQRLSEQAGFHGWPSPWDVAAMALPQADEVMDGLAQELGTMGFNLNFAPSVDLHDTASPVIGALGRSYGPNAETVSYWAGRHMQAHRRYGVKSVLKHFPGHGHARGDTHSGLTDVTAYWQVEEMHAFAHALKAYGADAVMTSHVVHRGLDPSGVPATFSRVMVQTLLREQLGYDGVIMSDDLGMGALVAHYDTETIVAKALYSGHDFLLFGLNAAAAGKGQRGHVPIPHLYELAVQVVREGLQSGALSAHDLARTYERVATFTQKIPPCAP
jgi:beta-N-acetylhexosaminidase